MASNPRSSQKAYQSNDNDNYNDNDNDNEYFILTCELVKLIICNTTINKYSNSQGNYIMTYISLACNYKISFVINSLCF